MQRDLSRLQAEAAQCYAQGDLPQALEKYSLLARLQPSAEAYNDLGVVYFALGQVHESRDYFLRALELDSAHSEAARNLEMACRAAGLPPERGRPRPERPAPAAEELFDISVVVPVHSRFDALDRSLEALQAQTMAPDRFEVILCANGVGPVRGELDRLVESHADSFHGRFTFAELPRASIAQARNEGVRRARGRLVLQINEDTVLSRTALEQHWSEHAELGFDPACVVVGGRRFPKSYLWSLFNYLHESVPLYTPLHRAVPRFLGNHTWFITCNLSAHRRAYERFGLYDPSFVWGSDQELGRRWEKQGARIYVAPRIVGYHLHWLTFDSWRKKCIEGAPYWFRRHTGKALDQITAEEREKVREELGSAEFLPAVVEGELRRLEREFRGPDSFAGQIVMGRLTRTLEEFTAALRPLLNDYRKHIHSQLWRDLLGGVQAGREATA